MPVGVEWLRVRDEVVSALSPMLGGGRVSEHIAETPLFGFATALLNQAAEIYVRLPPPDRLRGRGKHYLLISGIVSHSVVCGGSEEKCIRALWAILDEYLDGLN
jgi:hypothetical protein